MSALRKAANKDDLSMSYLDLSCMLRGVRLPLDPDLSDGPNWVGIVSNSIISCARFLYGNHMIGETIASLRGPQHTMHK
jgi:hypothetical protein